MFYLIVSYVKCLVDPSFVLQKSWNPQETQWSRSHGRSAEYAMSVWHDVVNRLMLLILQSLSYDATITPDLEEVQISNSDFLNALILGRSPRRDKPKLSHETEALTGYFHAICTRYLSLIFLLSVFLCFPSSYFLLICFFALRLPIPFLCYTALHPRGL
jgi:hypothetical protein